MNSTRSLRSNPGATGRASPNLASSKVDGFTNRPSSPVTNVNRSSQLRDRENDERMNLSPMKGFTEDDRRYHKVVFERCVDSPNRQVINDRGKFGQGKSRDFRRLRDTFPSSFSVELCWI